MTHYITISDNDVLSMEESTGNITISREKLPPRINDKEAVVIHFTEDNDNISHKYIIEGDQNLLDTVTLTWVEQLTEEILTEAPSRTSWMDRASARRDRADKKDAARAEKKHNKILNNAEKLLKRDMSPAARSWKFYFQKPDGKYEKAVDQNEAERRYRAMGDGELTADVANAIVITDRGTIVRRGMEDLDMKGVRLTKESAKLKPEYTLSWTEEDPFDPSAEDNTETNTTNTTAPTNEQPTETAQDNSNDGDNNQGSEETTTPENDTQSTSEPSNDNKSSNNRYDLGISSNTYGHFLKLLYVMRPKLFDAFDKPVDVSNIRTLADKVKYNNLADFEIEIDGRKIPAIKWIKAAVKNKVLMEKVLSESPTIKFDDEDLFDPSSISIKDTIRKAIDREQLAKEHATREAKQQALKTGYAHVPNDLDASIRRGDSTIDTLEVLFDDLVPPSGPAVSVAGELVRAVTRILVRDSNDGDKFFEGYGLESCASDAEYLFDHGFSEDIQNILDKAFLFSDNDQKYTDAITLLAQHVIEAIRQDESLIWEFNEEDSREYSNDYIVENQPTYEYQIEGSEDIIQLVDNGVIDAWDLNHYVEDQLEWSPAYKGAEVDIPWSHNSTEVTISKLTRDGYDLIHDSYSRDPDAFWSDLVAEHADELENTPYDDDYDLRTEEE